ncbi:phospholipase D family protein [Lysobacter auxotrophicus]|uniref:phospholipase D family protein n=1 Tax=Lysobacter auxotrophicus TaxID=2992573 RepID=UPI003CCE3642
MIRVLTSPEDIVTALRSVLRSCRGAKIAVPYWSAASIHILGLSERRLAGMCVICNSSSEMCSPDAIKHLQRLGAHVRSLGSLHAKVYAGRQGAVVGSANASSHALRASGWNELCVLTNEPGALKAIDTWFEQLWRAATDL